MIAYVGVFSIIILAILEIMLLSLWGAVYIRDHEPLKTSLLKLLFPIVTIVITFSFIPSALRIVMNL